MTTRSLDSASNILAFSFVLELEWSTDRLINHDVDAQHDEEEGKFENTDVDNYEDYYDDDEVKFPATALALIQTMMMMVMMKITTKRSC